MCQSVLLMFSLFDMLGLSQGLMQGSPCVHPRAGDIGGGSPGLAKPGKVSWCPPLHLHSFSEPMDNSFLVFLQ